MYVFRCLGPYGEIIGIMCTPLGLYYCSGTISGIYSCRGSHLGILSVASTQVCVNVSIFILCRICLESQ